MTLQSTSFWDFSNQLYDKDDIALICLQLQADFQIDVNLFLFCFWAANFEDAPSESEWDEILKFSIAWKKNIVQPLRNVRNSLKAMPLDHSDKAKYTELRDHVKRDELAAEKLQQEFIQSCFNRTEQRGQQFSKKRALKNLSYMFSKFGVPISEELTKKLESIFARIHQS